MNNNRFPRKSRLLTKQSYALIFRQGKTIKSQNRLIKLFFLENELGFPRLGLAIAKKHNAKATQRNRIKRQLRETFRRLQHKIHHHDLIVMSVNGKNYSKQQISASFIECLKQINDKNICMDD